MKTAEKTEIKPQRSPIWTYLCAICVLFLLVIFMFGDVLFAPNPPILSSYEKGDLATEYV